MKSSHSPSHFHISPEALAAFSRLREPVWIFDIEGKRVVWANDAALRVWAAESLDELLSRDFASDMSQSVAQRLTQSQEDFTRSDAIFSETWTIYPKGHPVTLNMRLSGIVLKDERMAMLCEGWETKDIDTETMRCSEALLHTTVMITLFSEDGYALYRNPAARNAVRNVEETLPERFVDSNAYTTLMNQLKLTGTGRIVAAIHTKFGVAWNDVSVRLCYDAVTGKRAVLISAVDVTELQRAKDRATHLATHDVVTGLFNRRYMMENFPLFLKQVEERRFEAALLLIDIDYFKYINESVGHEAGERVLVEVADRLRSCLSSEDKLARVGGDEFMIQTTAVDAAFRVRQLVGQIQETFAVPFIAGGRTMPMTLSMGVACYPKDGMDVTALMKHADLSVYHSKNHGRNRVSFFDPSFRMANRSDIFHDGALHSALKNKEFTIFLQPRVDLHSGRIVGAEALARWISPRYGMVSPLVFISACEEFGLISELGAYIFELSAIEQKKYAQAGRNLKISVNLSPYQLRDPNLVRTIEKIVHKTECSTDLLEFEITESAMPEDSEAVLSTIHAIQDMGFKFAIDDFGTGYSNLSHIQKYPFDVLKIDRSFVNVETGQRRLAEMIIMMAQAMNYNTVAEGIETGDQLEWLRQRGVNEYQGFFFSKPLPLDEFATLVKNKDAELKWAQAPANDAGSPTEDEEPSAISVNEP